MTKLKLEQEYVNHILNPNAFFFFLLTGEDITKLLVLFLHNIQAMKMILSELFLICTSKDNFFCRKTGLIWRTIWKKINPVVLMKFAFYNSAKTLFPLKKLLNYTKTKQKSYISPASSFGVCLFITAVFSLNQYYQL